MALMLEPPEGDDSQHSQVLRFTAESRAPQMSLSVLTAPVFRLLRSDKPARYSWKAKQKGVL